MVTNVNLVESSARARASVYLPNAAKLSKYGVYDMGGSVRHDGDVVAAWANWTSTLKANSNSLHCRAWGVYESGGGPIHAF